MDNINSVQFCCHTGHSVWQGQVLDETDLTTLFDGLIQNNLHTSYTHILTGYMRSLSFLKKVYDVVKQVKISNPNAIYVCDPVMGDAGAMYVPKELLPFFRDKLIGLADVLTPNQFEAELLTGVKVDNDKSALAAIDILHEKGIKTVVISSADVDSQEVITCYGSQVTPDGSKKRVKVEIPKLPCTFVGTGDLTAALLLAWLHKSKDDLDIGCSQTMSTVKAILNRTFNSAVSCNEGLCAKTLELKLVQSKRDIELPPALIKSIPLS